MIHDDWDFTLSAVLHSVTVAVLTTTGDGQTLDVHVKPVFASALVMDFNV